MRTRSKVRSEKIEHAASNEDGKPNRNRKRKDDDPAVGDRRKRCKIQSCKNVVMSSQSMAAQVMSPPKEQRLSSAEPERAAEVSFASCTSKDDDDEIILEKFVGALRKRRAANRSPPNATGEKSCASLKKAIAKEHGTKGSHDGPQVRKNPCARNTKELPDGGATVSAPHGTLPQGKTEKHRCLHHKKGGHSIGSCLKESTQGEQNGSLPSVGERLKKQLLRSGKRKCRPDNIKRLTKESTGSLRLTDISQKSNSSYSIRRLSGAKLRWKNLARSIYSREGIHKKEHKQQPSLVKLMKTWLTEAKFSQSANDAGDDFITTQDERHAFTQSMVRSCQANPRMRTVFLESVRMLAMSGVMQAAASNLLQQGPCDEAHNVMNAWAHFKEQSSTEKAFPMNLLNAVNELHEKGGDFSIKLTTPNVSGMCTMSQVDEHTWKFQVPRSLGGR